MPIYAYRCEACGHRQDVLQKISDPALQTCPSCGAPSFVKQVTAAGFQLKGSGWYATDFRGNGKGSDAKKSDAPSEGGGKGEGASAPAPTPAPAGPGTSGSPASDPS